MTPRGNHGRLYLERVEVHTKRIKCVLKAGRVIAGAIHLPVTEVKGEPVRIQAIRDVYLGGAAGVGTLRKPRIWHRGSVLETALRVVVGAVGEYRRGRLR